MTDVALTCWTIYDHPRDYPYHWVVRAHDIPGGPRQQCSTHETLEQARAVIPLGFICLPRHQRDDIYIFETWL
jgi:hypothetical protein